MEKTLIDYLQLRTKVYTTHVGHSRRRGGGDLAFHYEMQSKRGTLRIRETCLSAHVELTSVSRCDERIIRIRFVNTDI